MTSTSLHKFIVANWTLCFILPSGLFSNSMSHNIIGMARNSRVSCCGNLYWAISVINKDTPLLRNDNYILTGSWAR